jgi:RNA polymerase sigma-70 factor, ECF subfamily
MQPIDKDLLIKASEANMEAFEKIYKISSGFVYGIALRITNNREDAQEATQNVFLNLYKNIKKFQFRSSFKTWLYRIAVNAAINVYKKRAKDTGKRVDYDVVDKIEEVKDPAKEAVDRHDSKERIASLLEKLNPDQRACIVLREIEGLSYKEIADALKININNVRTRLKRAREALLAYARSEVIKNEL